NLCQQCRQTKKSKACYRQPPTERLWIGANLFPSKCSLKDGLSGIGDHPEFSPSRPPITTVVSETARKSTMSDFSVQFTDGRGRVSRTGNQNSKCPSLVASVSTSSAGTCKRKSRRIDATSRASAFVPHGIFATDQFVDRCATSCRSSFIS